MNVRTLVVFLVWFEDAIRYGETVEPKYGLTEVSAMPSFLVYLLITAIFSLDDSWSSCAYYFSEILL